MYEINICLLCSIYIYIFLFLSIISDISTTAPENKYKFLLQGSRKIVHLSSSLAFILPWSNRVSDLSSYHINKYKFLLSAYSLNVYYHI